ncbi:MAG: DUF4382 domain-containing protein [Gemmatimonadales bacterium]
MRKPTLAATACLGVLLAAACYQDDSTAPGSLRPLARVFLTDAPFPYDSVASVNVYVVSVAASTDPDTSGGGAWETIAQPKRRFDLLALQQGTTALLGEGRLTGQLYRAIRVVIDADSSSVRWSGGSDADVRWPWPGSGQITMYALVLEPLFSLAGTDDVEIVIDWDVGKSFLYDYFGTGEFTVLPWLRAVHRAFTGTIAGTVTSAYTGATQPVANANITVYGGDPNQPSGTWWVAATGRSDAQGAYRVAFVSDGTYIVRIEQSQYPFLAAVTRSGVTVAAGETTHVSVSLPEAGAGGAYLRISGPSSVGVGGSIILRAAVGDDAGEPVSSPSVAWRSSDTTVARVVGVGDTAAVTGRQVGFATISATSNGVSDSLTVEVVGQPQPVATVTVLPATASMAVNDSGGFRAELRDAGGNVLTHRPASWFSTDTTVLKIEGSFGEHVVVRARKAGAAALRASSEGKVGEANVTVH